MRIPPAPAFALDLGRAAAFAIARLMLRLSLNVSSTKLLIGQGHEEGGA